MPRRMKIPTEQLGAFVLLRDLGALKVDALATALPPVMLQTSVLEDELRKFGIEEPGPLSRTLYTLAHAALHESTSSILDATTEALRQARWADDQLAAWVACRAAMQRLLDAPGLVVLVKSLHLQYEHANILTGVHAVTDVRPVFNRDASQALAAIICHTLTIEYLCGGESRQITLAVDTPDLEQIVKHAQRGLTKAKTLEVYLAAPTSLPTRVAGERTGDQNGT